MLAVDDDVEVKLLQALKGFVNSYNEMGSILLKFPDSRISPQALQTALPQMVRSELAPAESKIYFCENGDIFILSPILQMELAHQLALSVAKAFDVTSMDCEFHFYNTDTESEQLLTEVARRLEKKAPLSERRTQRRDTKIMMIEDDAFSRRLAGRILSKEYHLTVLEHAECALETYTNIVPDILFLNIKLPDVNGHELLERILQLDPDAYIIILSDNTDQASVIEAMQQGAKGFITKPLTPEKMYPYIKRCPAIKNRSHRAYH